MNKNKSELDIFSERCEQIDVYEEIIRFNGLDVKIRDKWDYPGFPTTKKDVTEWQLKFPQKYKGYWNDIKILVSILNLPQDRVDIIGQMIGRRVIPIHGNRMVTKFEKNKITKQKELWIQINKSTSSNDIKKMWSKKIKPLQKQLMDKIFDCDDFKFDKKIYEYKKSGLSNDEIIKIGMEKYKRNLDYKLIDSAVNRYKKIVVIDSKILSTF
jgi:hypothetical protein